MNILNNDPVKGLISKSESEIGIFNKTISRLQDLSKQMRFQIAKRKEVVSKTEAEISTLEGAVSKNDKFCSKLSTFLDE